MKIKDFLKMQRHYGILRDSIDEFKSICFPPPTHVKTHKRLQDHNRQGVCDISADLNGRLEHIRELSNQTNHVFEKPVDITVIAYSIPHPDITSSDFRLYNILKIMIENKCRIDFIFCESRYDDSKYLKMFDGHINFIYLPLNSKDYIDFISEKTPTYLWITELWRVDYMKFMARIASELKASFTASKIIVDTIDFHFKEFNRKFELSKQPADLKTANDYLEIEKILYPIADTVVVVSKDEKRDIQNQIADIRNIEIVPNIHKTLDEIRPFNKRKNICFVGYFGPNHNVDAVKYFLKDIFPLILEKKPKTEFHVLGYRALQYTREFSSRNVKVIGRINQLRKALSYYKLFVCPMTYGSGIKGKIGDAISAGTPVVTTSIGAEGFPVKDGAELFIADSPSEFAEKCCLCLSDPVIWNNLSSRAMLMMNEHFSPATVAAQLKVILSN